LPAQVEYGDVAKLDKAWVCKTLIMGSNPIVASIEKIKNTCKGVFIFKLMGLASSYLADPIVTSIKINA
jgi:hypothetical protein